MTSPVEAATEREREENARAAAEVENAAAHAAVRAHKRAAAKHAREKAKSLAQNLGLGSADPSLLAPAEAADPAEAEVEQDQPGDQAG